MKRIKDNDSDHVFAHLLGKNTIEIVRQKQRFIISGSDFTLIGTSSTGKEKMVLTVEDGKLIEDDLKFRDTPELSDEEKEAQAQAQKDAEENTETEEDAMKGRDKDGEDNGEGDDTEGKKEKGEKENGKE
nr:MAG TPA: hypothetical protein [Caudoviricetes sp.]